MNRPHLLLATLTGISATIFSPAFAMGPPACSHWETIPTAQVFFPLDAPVLKSPELKKVAKNCHAVNSIPSLVDPIYDLFLKPNYTEVECTLKAGEWAGPSKGFVNKSDPNLSQWLGFNGATPATLKYCGIS